jgi:hypothetical protein
MLLRQEVAACGVPWKACLLEGFDVCQAIPRSVVAQCQLLNSIYLGMIVLYDSCSTHACQEIIMHEMMVVGAIRPVRYLCLMRLHMASSAHPGSCCISAPLSALMVVCGFLCPPLQTLLGPWCPSSYHRRQLSSR